MGLIHWIFGNRRDESPAGPPADPEIAVDLDAEMELLKRRIAADTEEHFFNNDGKQKVKLSERQAIMLIEIANDAARNMDEVAGYEVAEIDELLAEIRGQMNAAPVELGDAVIPLIAKNPAY